MVYLVTYDLKAPGKDYNDLYEVLKTFTWAHYIESAWFIDTSLTANQLRDKCTAVMDKNDNLFITEIKSGYSGWLSPKAWDWLSSHVKS